MGAAVYNKFWRRALGESGRGPVLPAAKRDAPACGHARLSVIQNASMPKMRLGRRARLARQHYGTSD